MPISRRRFLSRAGAALAGAVAGVHGMTEEGTAVARAGPAATAAFDPDDWPDDWDQVRAQFDLAGDVVDLSALYIASHPRTVREAIELHRAALDAHPTLHLEEQVNRREDDVLETAAGYLGASPNEIAITDSTTMGLGLLYSGIRLDPGDEIVTTEHDYFATHESVRLAAERAGATVRKIRLYDRIATVTAAEMVERAARAIRPSTRALAVTWVHSSTGLKTPIRGIADAVAAANADRDEAERVLLCVDGVHGFGVEPEGMTDLGCDFFAAGAHKWLFGPRGTGILWGRPAAWARTLPTIPSFMDAGLWRAWFRGEAPEGPTTGRRMSPGGFKPFEHQWAMVEAFRFHLAIGKARVAARTHELARRLKQGLAAMPHVELVTPMADELSSGIVCFDVDGLDAGGTVRRLRERGIVATVTPYATRHARLAPSIRNSVEEIHAALTAVRALA